MATMTELPYELLHYIILLLVQSPGGAADFARIISVCKNFIFLAQDERILKLVNFDMKMELANFKRYQHINSLLVKCSEAGNIAAQFLLGKVILVSSSQLLLCEWQKAKCGFHTFDFANLGEISRILATNVPAQDYEVGSFMTYFLPKQASTSEFSQTRLVHYQLVKLFLLNGSHHDIAEMDVFLKNYIEFFSSSTEEESLLIKSIKFLGFYAKCIRYAEKQLLLVEHCSTRSEGVLNAISNQVDRMKRTLAEIRARTLGFFERNFG